MKIWLPSTSRTAEARPRTHRLTVSSLLSSPGSILHFLVRMQERINCSSRNKTAPSVHVAIYPTVFYRNIIYYSTLARLSYVQRTFLHFRSRERQRQNCRTIWNSIGDYNCGGLVVNNGVDCKPTYVERNLSPAELSITAPTHEILGNDSAGNRVQIVYKLMRRENSLFVVSATYHKLARVEVSENRSNTKAQRDETVAIKERVAVIVSTDNRHNTMWHRKLRHCWWYLSVNYFTRPLFVEVSLVGWSANTTRTLVILSLTHFTTFATTFKLINCFVESLQHFTDFYLNILTLQQLPHKLSNPSTIST